MPTRPDNCTKCIYPEIEERQIEALWKIPVCTHIAVWEGLIDWKELPETFYIRVPYWCPL